MISYPDFHDSWNYEGHECPGPELFSRLIRVVQRPGGGTVEKVPTRANMVNYTNRAGNNMRTRPFKFVRFKGAEEDA